MYSDWSMYIIVSSPTPLRNVCAMSCWRMSMRPYREIKIKKKKHCFTDLTRLRSRWPRYIEYNTCVHRVRVTLFNVRHYHWRFYCFHIVRGYNAIYVIHSFMKKLILFNFNFLFECSLHAVLTLVISCHRAIN